jgi:hypothetical protein
MGMKRPKQHPKRQSQLSVILTDEQLAGLRALSGRTLAPMNALVRAAVTDYLQKRKTES